jgi:hypothetical protein
MMSDLSGRRLWTGLPGTGTDQILYGEPVWISNDVLRVPVDCNDSSGKTGEVTLVHEDGTWRWKSHLQCKG